MIIFSMLSKIENIKSKEKLLWLFSKQLIQCNCIAKAEEIHQNLTNTQFKNSIMKAIENIKARKI